MKNTFKKISYSQSCFRNIYTIHPTQDLYDDIVDPEDYDALFELEKNSSLIEKLEPNKARVFQYGKSDELFKPFNPPWSEGRFGDGKRYGVLYCAEDKETSYIEAFWHWIRWTRNMHRESAKDWIYTDRTVFELDIQSSAFASFLKDKVNRSRLISDDYSYCRTLAGQAIEERIDGFQTPSARNAPGVCVPIFEKSVIKTDKKIKYIKFGCNVKTGVMRIENETVEIPFSYEQAISS